jgi:16S rRNA (guanine1516-N2)-methyltransferase
MSGLPDFIDARVVPPDEIAAFGLPPLPAGDNRYHEHDGLVLVCDEGGPYLELLDGKRRTRLVVDFHSGALQYRAQIHMARSEMLVRACGVPKDGSLWRVTDATAGLGRDAFLLAFCGAQVTLVERHPLLALLLRHALGELAGGQENAALQDSRGSAARVLPPGSDAAIAEAAHSGAAVAARMHLVEHESVPYLNALAAAQRPQVVYCDPMFPPRNKSAAVSGDMQILHALVGGTPDEGDLLAAALRTATRRVVVKRPLRAEALTASGLAGIRPSFALEGRASRFDVYLIETLPL